MTKIIIIIIINQLSVSLYISQQKSYISHYTPHGSDVVVVIYKLCARNYVPTDFPCTTQTQFPIVSVCYSSSQRFNMFIVRVNP